MFCISRFQSKVYTYNEANPYFYFSDKVKPTHVLLKGSHVDMVSPFCET